MFNRPIVAAALTVVSLLSSSALACAWTLEQQTARLSFASVKNDHIAELHRFTEVSGAWAGSNVTIRIPVSSLDTLIPIRNERMAEHLFKANENPLIEAHATVHPTQLAALKVGDSLVLDLAITLQLAGQRGQVPATVQVTKVSNKRLLATTVQPIMIDSKAFDLTAGIETLREIAGLASIDLVVPVTFSVAFTQPG